MRSTLTTKGQLTLPAELRRKLHLQAGDQVDFVLRADGRIEMIPLQQSIDDLKGILPPPAKPVSLEEMQRAIEGEDHA